MPLVASDPPAAAARPTVWRITDRRSFARLRRDGARVRGHALSVTWAPPTGTGPAVPRVAFAVARRAGGAVVRNRIRRRLRAACRDLAVRDALPAGDYLLGAGPEAAARPWPELVADLEATVARATRSAP